MSLRRRGPNRVRFVFVAHAHPPHGGKHTSHMHVHGPAKSRHATAAQASPWQCDQRCTRGTSRAHRRTCRGGPSWRGEPHPATQARRRGSSRGGQRCHRRRTGYQAGRPSGSRGSCSHRSFDRRPHHPPFVLGLLREEHAGYALQFRKVGEFASGITESGHEIADALFQCPSRGSQFVGGGRTRVCVATFPEQAGVTHVADVPARVAP